MLYFFSFCCIYLSKTFQIIFRYNKDVLPNTEEGLKVFLENLWQRKEQSLKDFFDNGNFPSGPRLQNKSREIYFALFFWSVLPVFVFFLLCYSALFKYIVVIHTVFLLFVNSYFGGFQNFEVDVFNFKKKYFLKKKR